MKKMMFLLMMICLSANAWAQSGNCGKANATDVTWSYDAATTTLTISGTGDMADFTSRTVPWYDNCSANITSVVIKSGVTSIGNYAFYDSPNLKSVSIPNSVTGIGSYAFNGCTALTSVSIPNSVTGIGSYAFNGCI